MFTIVAWKTGSSTTSFLLLMFCLLLFSWVFVWSVRARSLCNWCAAGTACKIRWSIFTRFVKEIIFTHCDSFGSRWMLDFILIVLRFLISCILKFETLYISYQSILVIGLLVFLLLTLLGIVHIVVRYIWRSNILIWFLRFLINLSWLTQNQTRILLCYRTLCINGIGVVLLDHKFNIFLSFVIVEAFPFLHLLINYSLMFISIVCTFVSMANFLVFLSDRPCTFIIGMSIINLLRVFSDMLVQIYIFSSGVDLVVDYHRFYDFPHVFFISQSFENVSQTRQLSILWIVVPTQYG